MNKYDALLEDEAPDNKYSAIVADDNAESFMETYARRYEESPRAVLETASTLATGFAGTAVGGFAGAAVAGVNAAIAGVGGDTGISAGNVVRDVQEALTYQPRSTTGKEAVATLAYPFEKLHEVARWGGEKTLDATDSAAAAAATETVIDFVPWLFLPKVVRMTKAGVQKVTAPMRAPLAKVSGAVRDVVTPIAGGGAEARVAAKTYANSINRANVLRNDTLENMRTNFKRNEFDVMGEALINEELAYKIGKPTAKGITSLTIKQQEAVTALMKRNDIIANEAVKLGVLKKKHDVYFPRELIGELGETAQKGIYESAKVKTTTPHALRRKYLTVEETAKAASKKYDADLQVSRDIRVLPMVTAELEKAVIGKKLIREIEGFGKDMGLETVSGRQRAGYFTINDPAFTKWRPRMKKDDQGKWRAVRDDAGGTVMDRQPIYLHESFKAPLSAVFRPQPNVLTRGFYNLKAKSMHMIMFSPLLHGSVLWGKALPYQPVRTLTFRNYYQGYKFLRDPAYVRRHTPYKTPQEFMSAAADDGVREIGKMAWMQRMSDVLQPPHLEVGRSLTAKTLGGVARVFGKRAQHGTKLAVDAAGRFWHDTLLWDRVRDMQYGLYHHIKSGMIKNGASAEAAGPVAAHLANRFAGSIPLEDMGHGVRAALNIGLFSRSFNATNMGIYKDALKGLPEAVQDIIIKSGSNVDVQLANSALRKAAGGALVKDIVAMYLMNSAVQNLFDYMRTGDAGEIAQEYSERWHRYADEVKANPLAAVFEIEELSATAENEPGKQTRVYIGDDPLGRGIYWKNPLGKIGEDLLKAGSSPLELLSNKISPTMNFAVGLYLNDKSGRADYGLPVYKEHGDWGEVPANIGKIAYWFFESHTPSTYIEAVLDVATGNDPTGIQKLRATLQPIGGQFSRGAPAGPTQGIAFEILDAHAEEIKFHVKDIRSALLAGKTEAAIDIMIDKAGMSPREVQSMISRTLGPVVSEQLLRDAIIVANEKERARIERSLRKQYRVDE